MAPAFCRGGCEGAWQRQRETCQIEVSLRGLYIFEERNFSRDPGPPAAESQIRMVLMTCFSTIGKAEFKCMNRALRGKGDAGLDEELCPPVGPQNSDLFGRFLLSLF